MLFACQFVCLSIFAPDKDTNTDLNLYAESSREYILLPSRYVKLLTPITHKVFIRNPEGAPPTPHDSVQ